ncbi:hypothetical protein ACQPZP_28915 [Spirillospora sp. CA-142024]|uniref:hypothetical protein n=1 Tax=Spirillospora sp. CA-142024 TaxID=3240036 RepID=UPI003D8B4394
MTTKRAHCVAAVLVAAFVGGIAGGSFGASVVATGVGALGAVLGAVVVIYGRYLGRAADGVRNIGKRFGFVGGVGICAVGSVGYIAFIFGYDIALTAMPLAGFYSTVVAGIAVGLIRKGVVGD